MLFTVSKIVLRFFSNYQSEINRRNHFSRVFFSSTYFLGQRRNFNDQLNDTTKRFTYFAPYDKAWAQAATSYPSAVKKLFMPEFSYHVSNLPKCVLHIELIFKFVFIDAFVILEY